MTDRPNQPEPSEAFGAAGQGEATPSGKRQSKPSSKPALKKRKAKIKHPTVTPARPSWATYASWVQTRQGHVLAPGLYFHGIRDDAETDTLVCSPLEVLAITCDERGENFGRLLHLLPKGASAWKQWAAPMEMLAGDGAELRAVLHEGGWLPDDAPPATARAVVGTRIGGTPEAVQDEVTGLLVERSDAEGLARAIERLLRDPELGRDLGRRAAAAVGVKFGADRIVPELLAAYRRTQA